jgi:hypothetical protein
VTASINLIGLRRGWPAEWAEFETRHPSFTADEPIYSLPESAIKVLAGSWGKRSAVLDAARAQSEREFTELCARHRAVGVWRGQKVDYEYLLPQLPPLRADQIPPGFESHLREVADTPVRTAAIHSGLRGVAGWLLTEPTFLKEVAAVRATWEALPVSARPPFPLTRAYRVASPPSSAAPVDEPTDCFADGFDNLMDRWGLTRLVVHHV